MLTMLLLSFRSCNLLAGFVLNFRQLDLSVEVNNDVVGFVFIVWSAFNVWQMVHALENMFQVFYLLILMFELDHTGETFLWIMEIWNLDLWTCYYVKMHNKTHSLSCFIVNSLSLWIFIWSVKCVLLAWRLLLSSAVVCLKRSEL